ncbi:MAG: hypothetical protein JWO13_3134 [Acidobacteriales bacterium]|nr:hypothetical protein [Terriglobales bacterium]
MALDTVTLVLDGEVPLSEFANAIANFNELVNALSEEVGGSQLDWVIDDLQYSSSVATVRSRENPEATARVVEAYSRVGSSLESRTAIPYSPRIGNVANKVVSISDRRVRAVRFETPVTESTVMLNKPAVLAPILALPTAIKNLVLPHPKPAYGGIKGRVQTLTNRGGLRFTLFDLLNDKAVSCYIEEGQEELLRDVWGKMVLVEGLIARDPGNGRPISVRHIANISPQPDPHTGYEYEKARSSAPSLSGMSPEEAIRRLRDAQ